MDTDHDQLSRRRLLAGLGAAGGGALLGGAALASPAAAGPGGEDVFGEGFPVDLATNLSSVPEPGVTYLFLSQHDFRVLVGDEVQSFTGAYGSTSATVVLATAPIPPGAVLHDVEWYTANTIAMVANVTAWSPGNTPTSLLAGSIAAQGDANVHAHRFTFGVATNGPFPLGTKLFVGGSTNTAATIRYQGMRLGYKPGGLETYLLPTPVRAYDSRSTGGALQPNTTRTISVAGQVPLRATGVLYNLSLTNTHGFGSLRTGAGGTTPVTASIQWGATGDKVTSAVTSAVSPTRTIAIKSFSASGATDIIVDVIGFLV